MAAVSTEITIATSGQGLHLITREIERALAAELTREGPGLLNVFVQHTSCSLLIQENADPNARIDLEQFISLLVPEHQSWHSHLDEGPDDTVSHMKAAITATALQVPIEAGKLRLGTWQGIYLWEHRRSPHKRKLVLTVLY